MHGMCLQEQKGTEAVAAQTNPFLEMDVPDSHLHDLCNEVQLSDLAVHRVLEPPRCRKKRSHQGGHDGLVWRPLVER